MVQILDQRELGENTVLAAFRNSKSWIVAESWFDVKDTVEQPGVVCGVVAHDVQ